MTTTDPFAHHPELRGRIADPLTSRFRDFSIEVLARHMEALGLPGGWWHSDCDREAMRVGTLAGRREADLWIFGYGSLMWDPALCFAEVRRAHVPDHARRFILKDVNGARGTRDRPGLMAALDRGPGCDGLAFRIPRAEIETETQILWRREKVGPAYRAEFVTAMLDSGPVEALAFVADHAAGIIDGGITRAEQIRCLATGEGFLGTSLDYLRNIERHFDALGIHDPEVSTLLAETEAHLAEAG